MVSGGLILMVTWSHLMGHMGWFRYDSHIISSLSCRMWRRQLQMMTTTLCLRTWCTRPCCASCTTPPSSPTSITSAPPPSLHTSKVIGYTHRSHSERCDKEYSILQENWKHPRMKLSIHQVVRTFLVTIFSPALTSFFLRDYSLPWIFSILWVCHHVLLMHSWLSPPSLLFSGTTLLPVWQAWPLVRTLQSDVHQVCQH